MTAHRTIALSADVAAQVRTTLASPHYGHPARVEVASGYGPCRSCLATFREGEEERILFTLDPFRGLDDYPLPGPVFIHREGCRRFEEGAFPPGLRHLPLTFEGYGRERLIIARERTTAAAGPETVDAAIERLLAYPAIDYIHVRNSEAGCYIARIERADRSE